MPLTNRQINESVEFDVSKENRLRRTRKLGLKSFSLLFYWSKFFLIRAAQEKRVALFFLNSDINIDYRFQKAFMNSHQTFSGTR
jgi:hypothetical protein